MDGPKPDSISPADMESLRAMVDSLAESKAKEKLKAVEQSTTDQGIELTKLKVEYAELKAEHDKLQAENARLVHCVKAIHHSSGSIVDLLGSSASPQVAAPVCLASASIPASTPAPITAPAHVQRPALFPSPPTVVVTPQPVPNPPPAVLSSDIRAKRPRRAIGKVNYTEEDTEYVTEEDIPEEDEEVELSDFIEDEEVIALRPRSAFRAPVPTKKSGRSATASGIRKLGPGASESSSSYLPVTPYHKNRKHSKLHR